MHIKLIRYLTLIFPHSLTHAAPPACAQLFLDYRWTATSSIGSSASTYPVSVNKTYSSGTGHYMIWNASAVSVWENICVYCQEMSTDVRTAI